MQTNLKCFCFLIFNFVQNSQYKSNLNQPNATWNVIQFRNKPHWKLLNTTNRVKYQFKNLQKTKSHQNFITVFFDFEKSFEIVFGGETFGSTCRLIVNRYNWYVGIALNQWLVNRHRRQNLMHTHWSLILFNLLQWQSKNDTQLHLISILNEHHINIWTIQLILILNSNSNFNSFPNRFYSIEKRRCKQIVIKETMW